MDDHVAFGAQGRRISRRAVLAAAAALVASILPGCAAGRRAGPSWPGGTGGDGGDDFRHGRLRARPRPPEPGAAEVGLQPLGLEPERDGFVFVPSGASAGQPLPLVLMLHGAGGNGRAALAPFLDAADETGVILVGPDSRGRTWDVILHDYGPDVAFVDRALEHVFGRCAVDEDQVAVEGFSDGASYALGLGLVNGDLFRRVIGFSPGFAPRGRAEGRPPVFVSHGVDDEVLPIDRCSRRIVPALRQRGYEVRYVEFPGGHGVPAEIAAEALAWFRRGR